MTIGPEGARSASEPDSRDLVPDEAALMQLAPKPSGPVFMGHPPGLFLLFIWSILTGKGTTFYFELPERA